jgi:hypothetical protein
MPCFSPYVVVDVLLNINFCAFAVKLIGKLEDGTVFLKKGHDGEEAFEFKVDEEQVIGGLDVTVVNMKKGEIALARIPPQHAFGPTETKHDLASVPPNSTVFYEVELVSFEKVIRTEVYFSTHLSCYRLIRMCENMHLFCFRIKNLGI